ncbi:ankyrin repeat domain-containing protein [Caulobacter sp. UNC358MFTsu5.1]|uniref:ankyrin repeat domain-containing protein n=1 Tax=Caulobacter sp. UNC358MFTsu5.1 TaxID=1449049 RepID=UPI0004A70529|nr:ankyrin repeat domain-containing protein [Caulobacter sp. UNC358MFTsu5.1]
MRNTVSTAAVGAAVLLFVASAAPAFAAADLAKAAADQNIKKIDKLLAAGAAIDEVDTEGRSAFFHAAAKGDLSLMQKFAEKGAGVDLRDKSGATPLLAALRNPTSQADVVQFLLGKGADINAADQGGRTPLMEAVLRAPQVLDTDGQVAMVGLLLKAGADPNLADTSGAAPLHYAAYVGEPRKVLELLLASTKDTGVTTVSGANVLMMAAQNHQRSNADYLMARGFRPARIQFKPDEAAAKSELVQDMSFRANALAADWWGQYAARKSDPAAAKIAFAGAADDYDAAAAESARLIKVYEAKLVKDKQSRNNQRAAAGVATVLSVALTLGAGGNTITAFMPLLADVVEQDEAAIAALKAESTEFTARAKALRVQLAAN